MALQIYPIKAFNDNYIWAIVCQDSKQAILVDVGECSPALAFLKDNQLELSAIWITHHHDDHIAGVGELLEYYPTAQLFAHSKHGLNHYHPILLDSISQNLTTSNLDNASTINAFGRPVAVWQSFGHTDSHLSFGVDDGVCHVFCGDTLFRAGCGRVFTGTMSELYHSFERYSQMPDETLFYPAHEYTLANLAFAKACEPNNIAIDHAISQDKQKRANHQPTLPTILADEKAINPFMRAVCGDMGELSQTVAQKTGQTPKDRLELFSLLRELKNNF